MRLGRTIDPLLSLPRVKKRSLALTVDVSLCIITVWLSFYLRLGVWAYLTGNQWLAVILSIGLALPIFVVCGLYRAIFRYATRSSMLGVLRAVAIYGLVYSAVVTSVGIPGVPRTVGLIQPVLLLLAVGASRLFAHYWLGGAYQLILTRNDLPRAVIYGAGSAGRQLADAISHSREMRAVAFLDDNPGLQGSVLHGLKIWAPSELQRLVVEHNVSDVLLAIPSATRARRVEILELVRGTGVGVRTLPGLMDLAHGRVEATDLRQLEIEDLLGRNIIAPDPELLHDKIKGRTVLVTGAGGSIGSELCRQIILAKPDKLVLVDHSEFALYEIHQQLGQNSNEFGVDVIPILASVRDRPVFDEILAAHRPHILFHAAAYKHVPLIEENVLAGINNNIFGTLSAALSAAHAGVKDFVLISTDKAVRPTNVMGATKRVSEMTLQALELEYSSMRCSMVRFGNVLGSSGSVVPLFRRQIAEGGPVTVTHPEVRRYFMTIPEASQLVLQAAAMAQGGEVFVLDMGEPVRLLDLARSMIELSGLAVRDEANPEGDIELQFIGLRPGEKLYEELLIGNDPMATQHPQIMRAREKFLKWRDLLLHLDSLEACVTNRDAAGAVAILVTLVEDFTPSAGLLPVDWIEPRRHARA